jgi:hypothetical protein
MFTIASVFDASPYKAINCAYVSGSSALSSGSFSNGDDVLVTFARTGDIGDTGPQGPQGPQGPEGPQGPQGVAGPQGPQGVVGPQGPQGVIGDIGPQGPQGPSGPQGSRGPTGPTTSGVVVFEGGLANTDFSVGLNINCGGVN